MNAPTDISMKNDDVLRVELEVFRQEHRDLDQAITAMVDRGTADQLTVRRLKKKKLRLKDMIAIIEDRLTPDIIA
ncbi:MAG: YdcH family protein [Thalassovita sp.]